MDIRPPNRHVLRFGVFELDADSGELRRHGLKIRLPDQSFQILKTLLSRPAEVVTREELRRVLWTSETFVDFEVGLNSAVRKLREALGDSAENPRFVETLPRRGYRFVGSVIGADAKPPSDVAADQRPVAVSEPASEPRPEAMPPTAAAEGPRGLSEPVPTHRRFRRRVLLRAGGFALASILVAVAVAYQRGWLLDGRAGSDAEPIRSLVVLPFQNLTGDASQDSFVENVTDAVTTHLAQVAGLDVISRTSASLYKQRVRSLPEIGRELGVDGVVEGAVVRSGTAVRITAKLIRAATDRHVWAREYDGDFSHMLTLQQRIASDVAVATGRPARAPEGGRTSPAVNEQAYDAYLKGLTVQPLQRMDGLRRAVVYFEEAIAIQPDFAEAYAALAYAQLQFLFGGPLSPREAIPKAEAAARKALTFDETLGRAHWALGQILNLHYWRWDDGHKALQRASELLGDDNLVLALSESLVRQQRVAEAIAVAQRGRRLDPLSFNAQIGLASAYRAAGQHDRAVTEGRRAIEMSPGNPRPRFQLGITLTAMGRLDEAISELEFAARPTQVHNSRIEAYLGYAYAATGRTAEARQVLKELHSHRRDQYVSSFGIALIHDALGDKEPALISLEQALVDRAVEFAQSRHYPPFKAIASEPRFHAVMRRVGLTRQGS